MTPAGTQELIGRSALVTGAGTGIGAATAAALAAGGAHVAMIGRRLDKVSAVSETINARHPDATAAFAADVTDRNGLATAISQARNRFGAFDLVVANAGAMLAAPFDDADVAEWDPHDRDQPHRAPVDGPAHRRRPHLRGRRRGSGGSRADQFADGFGLHIGAFW